jgi:hypothetical protein
MFLVNNTFFLKAGSAALITFENRLVPVPLVLNWLQQIQKLLALIG